jgi:formylglycine-generating enzyme required for sulfatase activity
MSAPYRTAFFLLVSASLCGAGDSAVCKMILIPAGTFQMGSINGEKDERPVHIVRVDSFYLGETEVTVWEYLQCVHAGACRMPFWWNRRFFPEKVSDRSGGEWLSLPAIGVSWDDARAYCAWRSAGCRLPTEAEWEYAARGNAQTDYFWGNSPDSAPLYAVMKDRLLPVKSARPNMFGLHDMLGNAWEWCNDRYGSHYYSQSPPENPLGPADSLKHPYRVVRGGSWNEYLWNLRCANRSFGEQFRRFDGVGFRIARSARAK